MEEEEEAEEEERPSCLRTAAPPPPGRGSVLKKGIFKKKYSLLYTVVPGLIVKLFTTTPFEER